jgi:hypothetical protein
MQSFVAYAIERCERLLARFGRTFAQAEGRSDGPSLEVAFSVSQSNLEQVKQYFAVQEEHHRKIGFQDELRALLRKLEIEWDENLFRIESSPARDWHNRVGRLESETLGLFGVADILEGGPDGAEIIDYKRDSARRDAEGERVAKEPDAMQVAAHALLL